MDYASDLKGQVYQNPGDAFHLQKWLLLKPCMILRKDNVSHPTLHDLLTLDPRYNITNQSK